jgi:hypothetical protein
MRVKIVKEREKLFPHKKWFSSGYIYSGIEVSFFQLFHQSVSNQKKIPFPSF